MVRDKLWEKVLKQKGAGSCVQIFSAANEQGFEVRAAGDRSRELIRMEGLILVLKKKVV